MPAKTKPKPDSATENVIELPHEKVLISDLNTRQPTETEVKKSGLVDSIKVKQITPCIVRPHPTKKGYYELAAGARRRTACAVLGIPVKVIVRDMTNEELEDQILTDNLQREDPDPLAEAALVKRRLDAGASPKDLAAHYGQTVVWVQRRAKLSNLDPALIKLWRNKSSDDLSRFSVEMMEHLALFPAERQIELSKDWTVKRSSSLKDLIATTEKLSCQLNVPWLDDAATFVPGCGPGCASSSGAEKTLFGFSDKKECDRCLNPTCFNLRENLAGSAACEKLLAKHKVAVTQVHALFKDTYGRSSDKPIRITEGSTPVDFNVVPKWEIQGYDITKLPAKQTIKPTDLIGLNVSDLLHPTLYLLKPDKNSKQGKKLQAKAATAAASPEEAQAEKVATFQARRWALVRNKLKEALDEAPVPTGFHPLHWIGLAAQLGLCARQDYISETPDAYQTEVWNSLDQPEPTFTFDANASLWEDLRPVLTQRLFHIQKAESFKLPHILAEMRGIAKLIGFDLTTAKERVDLDELPLPKSWGKGLNSHTCLPDYDTSTPPPPAPAAPPPDDDSWKTPKSLAAGKKLLKGTADDAIYALEKCGDRKLLMSAFHLEKMGKGRKAVITAIRTLLDLPEPSTPTEPDDTSPPPYDDDED